MILRAATPDDRDPIAALHLASWQDSYGIVLPDHVLRDVLPGYLADKWAARSFASPMVTVVAEEVGALVGFACALTDEDPPLIDNLHVRPGLRGGGVGGRLLAAINVELAAIGHAQSYLTVLERNTRALAFYLANGGRDDGAFDDVLVDHPVRVRRITFDLQTGGGMG